MTTPTPTPEEHRRTAEELLAKVYEDAYAPMHPYRVDMLSRATVHALLALNGPREWHHNYRYEAVGIPAGGGGVTPTDDNPANPLDPSHPAHEPHWTDTDPVAKPAPRKRAAKKTTASKAAPA